MKTVNTSSAIIQLASDEFDAIESFDQCATDRDARLCALVASINYEPGKAASAEAVAEFKDIMGTWTKAYAGKMPGKDEKKNYLSAMRAWLRVTARCGIIKPQSADALRKTKEREASDKANPKGNHTVKIEPEKKIEAVKAAGSVKLELASIEAHLINMIRAAKFEQVHELIRQIEAGTAKL